MAKLYFRYGAMGSSKTANALMVRYNYIEKGQNPVLLKPGIENRDGEKVIRSRIGLEADCIFVEDFLSEVSNEWMTGKSDRYKTIDCIIIDEAQFLTEGQVDILADIVNRLHIGLIKIYHDYISLFATRKCIAIIKSHCMRAVNCCHLKNPTLVIT